MSHGSNWSLHIVQLNPPHGQQWYSPVIFHEPHSPRMWVWPNVSEKTRAEQVFLFNSCKVIKYKN